MNGCSYWPPRLRPLSCCWTVTIPRQGAEWKKNVHPRLEILLVLGTIVRGYLNIYTGQSCVNCLPSKILHPDRPFECQLPRITSERKDEIRSESSERWETPDLLSQRRSSETGHSSTAEARGRVAKSSPWRRPPEWQRQLRMVTSALQAQATQRVIGKANAQRRREKGDDCWVHTRAAPGISWKERQDYRQIFSRCDLSQFHCSDSDPSIT